MEFPLLESQSALVQASSDAVQGFDMGADCSLPGHTPDYSKEGFHVSVTISPTGRPHQRHGLQDSPGVR